MTADHMTALARLPDRAPNSEEEIMLSRIPLLAGESKKMDYLCWRSVGFNSYEAAELVEVTIDEILQWRKDDELFLNIESYRLADLQKTASKELLNLEFTRNFRLLLKQDLRIIWQAHFDPSSMSDREWSYYRQIRSYYKTLDFLNLEKANNPEKHREGPIQINLTLGFGHEGNSQAAIDAEFVEIEN